VRLEYPKRCGGSLVGKKIENTKLGPHRAAEHIELPKGIESQHVAHLINALEVVWHRYVLYRSIVPSAEIYLWACVSRKISPILLPDMFSVNPRRCGEDIRFRQLTTALLFHHQLPFADLDDTFTTPYTFSLGTSPQQGYGLSSQSKDSTLEHKEHERWNYVHVER